MELQAQGDARVPGFDRMRLVGALKYLPDPETPVDQSLEFGGFALITVAESCTACSACERACPTGAILFELEELKKTFTLSFKAQMCIGCGICSDVCEPQSISINSTPTFSDIFNSEDPTPLHSGNISRCERCNTVFAVREGSKLCPVCEYRRKNPFGSHMPVTMKKIPGTSPKEKAQ